MPPEEEMLPDWGPPGTAPQRADSIAGSAEWRGAE